MLMLYMMNPVLDDKERKKMHKKRVFIVEDLGWFSFKSKISWIYVILTKYKLPSGGEEDQMFVK